MSAKHSPSTKHARSSAEPPLPLPPVARTGRHVLRSSTVGALPILNQFLRRMRLEEFLHAALPREDRRTKLSPVKALLVLSRNLLVSRVPIYGVGEWAARHAAEALGLMPQEIGRLNDDCVGRALDRLFTADVPSLVLAVATHVVKEFGVSLDELHNDSTTVSFCGAYSNATVEQRVLGRPTLAITFGYNKDHRPDLKQLLFILTVTADGAVPLHFRAANGNVVDDQTHCQTWDLLCQLTGRRDFLYVADCKLATSENMATRFGLSYRIDDARVALDARSDGIFPLVTNVVDFSELELLHAYKRQPAIEKRFSQLKTDFEVAPVYLKAVHRIQALLCMYFFALLAEALLERQLRQAMQHQEIETLPMYPEGGACHWPTARRVIDLFESVQRHTLEHRQHPTEVMVTELTRLQRKLLKLIGLSAKDYGR